MPEYINCKQITESISLQYESCYLLPDEMMQEMEALGRSTVNAVGNGCFVLCGHANMARIC